VWQICADQAQEIRILICCARTFVDTVALLELAKRKTAGGDKVTLVEQLAPFPLTRIRQP
jgi:hypothetical protein